MSIYDKEQPQGQFIKFTSGMTAQVRLFGEPIDYIKTFIQNGVPQEPKQRFASLCIFRNKEAKTNEVRVIEFGWEIQKSLKAFWKDSDWGDNAHYDVKISATGDGLDRKYQVVPAPKTPLSADEKALIAACDIDLRAICKADGTGPGKEGESEPPYDPFSDQ